MSLFSVFLIGIGLSMDACAVSFAKGICLKKTSQNLCLETGTRLWIFPGNDAADRLVGRNLF